MINTALTTAVTGLQNSSLNVAKAANRIADPNIKSDLTTDIIDIKVNEQDFAANAEVVNTIQDMQETLLNAVDIEV